MVATPVRPDGSADSIRGEPRRRASLRWREQAKFGRPLAARAALRRNAAENNVVDVSEAADAVKYVVEGPLQAPDGRTPQVRTVWLQETDSPVPRLITASARKERKR
jgi:hypothetical protein